MSLFVLEALFVSDGLRLCLWLSLEAYWQCVCFRPRAALSARQVEIEKTMGKYNAVYTLLWKKSEDGAFRVIDEYTLEKRRRFLFMNNYVIIFFW